MKSCELSHELLTMAVILRSLIFHWVLGGYGKVRANFRILNTIFSEVLGRGGGKKTQVKYPRRL